MARRVWYFHQSVIKNRQKLRTLALSAVATLIAGQSTAADSTTFAADAVSTQRQAQSQLGSYLKNPDLATSRCMLPPILLPDGLTVAFPGGDHFEAGDAFKAINGTALDASAKRPVLDALMKIPPKSTVSVMFARRGMPLTVTVACVDAKDYYDLVIEATYAAAHNDFATCAAKLQSAASVHILTWVTHFLRWNCQKQIGQVIPESVPLSYYEIMRQRIAENRYSAGALDDMRGSILIASDWLKSHNADSLAIDLKKLLEDATSEAKGGHH
jgi:hypothetical protein